VIQISNHNSGSAGSCADGPDKKDAFVGGDKADRFRSFLIASVSP
jgi:hypothetical protein